MSKRKNSKPKQKQSLAPRSALHRQLDQVERLLDAGQPDLAFEMLSLLSQDYPDSVDVWSLLLEANHAQQNALGLWRAVHALMRLEPNEPTHLFNAFNIAGMNAMIFTADKYADEFLQRFATDENARFIREQQPSIKKAIAKIFASDSVETAATAQDLLDLERIQMSLNNSEFKLAEEIALQVSQRSPDMIAPLNNLSIAYVSQGKLNEAIATAQHVLDSHPDNIHALSNLIQYLVRVGRHTEAEALVDRLCEQTTRDDWFVKQIEALSYLDDNKRIIALYERNKAPQQDDPILQHLVAVAYARQGDKKRAEQLWRKAVKTKRATPTAEENLENSRLPVGERSPAFPFSLHQWVPRIWIENLIEVIERHPKSEKALKTAVDKSLQASPGLRAVLSILLERGDPAGRKFAVHTAIAAQSPLLSEFALGEYGTDEERINAAQQAADLGLMATDKPVELLIAGKRSPIFLLEYDITDEPDMTGIPEAVQDLIAETHTALMQGQYVKAENMAREAIEVAPNTPSLWNHLGVALEAQRRVKERDALTRQIVERFPDYFFGKLDYIRLLIREGKLTEARTQLNPLMQKKKYHVSEFAAICTANIEYFIANKQPAAAKSWCSMWEDVDPDNSSLHYFQDVLKLF